MSFRIPVLLTAVEVLILCLPFMVDKTFSSWLNFSSHIWRNGSMKSATSFIFSGLKW